MCVVRRAYMPRKSSNRMSLCKSTPLLIFATVMAAITTIAPTRNPCAHPSNASCSQSQHHDIGKMNCIDLTPSGEVGFVAPAVNFSTMANGLVCGVGAIAECIFLSSPEALAHTLLLVHESKSR